MAALQEARGSHAGDLGGLGVVHFVGWSGIVAVLAKDATTAWVQAIGSLAAVAVAVAVVIMKQQITHDNESDRDSDLRKMHMIQAAVFYARMTAIRVLRRVEEQGNSVRGLNDLTARMETLASAPMFEYPTYASWNFVELRQEEFRWLRDGWARVAVDGESSQAERLAALSEFIVSALNTEVALEDNTLEEFDVHLGAHCAKMKDGPWFFSGRIGWKEVHGVRYGEESPKDANEAEPAPPVMSAPGDAGPPSSSV